MPVLTVLLLDIIFSNLNSRLKCEADSQGYNSKLITKLDCLR